MPKITVLKKRKDFEKKFKGLSEGEKKAMLIRLFFLNFKKKNEQKKI